MKKFRTVLLGDKELFFVDNGKRLRKEDINLAKGKIPVYSTSKFKEDCLGHVSDEITQIVKNAKKFSGKFITVNADGSVGRVFIREGEFYANDVLNVIKVLNKNILEEYLLHELQNRLLFLGYSSWSNKLYKEKLRSVEIRIPIKDDGSFDLNYQKIIAKKYDKLDGLKENLISMYDTFNSLNVSIEKKYLTKEFFIDEIFDIEKGNSKYTKDYMRNNLGEYPVFSSQTIKKGVIGKINSFDYDKECLTWTTDGIYAGTVFYRNGKFSMTTHCGALILKDEYKDKIDLRYVLYQLNLYLKSHATGEGNKRVTVGIIKKVPLKVIVDKDGEINISKQKEISTKYDKIKNIKSKVKQHFEELLEKEIEYN